MSIDRWMGKEDAVYLHNGIFSSAAQSCLTLWDATNRSTPDLPVHHQLPEFYSSILAWRFHGQRSLAGYSPWDCKESDTLVVKPLLVTGTGTQVYWSADNVLLLGLGSSYQVGQVCQFAQIHQAVYKKLNNFSMSNFTTAQMWLIPD